MDYLTVKEVAELKGCGERYIKKICKEQKIQAELQPHPQNKQPCYMIPVSALSEDLQAKYYARLKKETGLAPKLKEEKEPLKKNLKGSKKAFEEYSEAEQPNGATFLGNGRNSERITRKRLILILTLSASAVSNTRIFR